MKFGYDSGHHNCFGPDRDLISKFGNKIDALHLDDNMGDSDIHMLPFDGTANWKSIIEKLAKSNYNGAISLEVKQDRHEMYTDLLPEEFLKTAYEKALKIERLLCERRAR